jgi:hypothetical protein
MVQGLFPHQYELNVESKHFIQCAATFLHLAIIQFRNEENLEASSLSEVISNFKKYHHISNDEEILLPLIGSAEYNRMQKENPEQDLLEKYSMPGEFALESYLRNWIGSSNDKILYTRTGYLAYGPSKSKERDLICVLQGFGGLLILRKVKSKYTVIGECYAIGLADGEVLDMLDKGGIKLADIEIQ